MSTFSVRLNDDPIHKGVLVRLTGRPLKQRRCLNLTIVLDVSGSMSKTASMPSSNGTSVESYAFTLLDVVKHACKSIAQQLGETDVLSLISFSTNALVQFAPQKISAAGRRNFFNALERLEPDQQTNLFAGINLGVQTLRAAADIADPDALHQIIVLTDGESNVIPAIGNVKSVEKLFAGCKENNFIFTLNTLALGFDSMQSKELATLAKICNQGGFTYIPDMGMVGSVFVNLLSTMFSTAEQSIQITVNDNIGETIIKTVPLLQSGQVVDVWIPVQSVAGVDLTVNLPDDQQCDEPLTDADNLFAHANECLLQALETEANRIISPKYTETYNLSDWCTFNIMQHLAPYIDMQSEGIKALSPDFHRKWGRHYLQSLLSAHSRRVCNNFKDNGVQLYAVPFFLECQADGNNAFNSLPPLVANPSCGSGGIVIASSSSLNTTDNPCVHAHSLVRMANHTYKRAQDIVKGDVVKTEKVLVDGKVVDTTTIQCVVKTLCENRKADLCFIENDMFDTPLMITPNHPITTESDPLSFSFPVNHASPTEVGCEAVYSFLFQESDAGKTMIINGTHVIALGNNVTTGVAAHPFFSPYATISADLQHFKGWSNGYITLAHNPMLRNASTNLVCGFDYKKEIY